MVASRTRMCGAAAAALFFCGFVGEFAAACGTGLTGVVIETRFVVDQ